VGVFRAIGLALVWNTVDDAALPGNQRRGLTERLRSFTVIRQEPGCIELDGQSTQTESVSPPFDGGRYHSYDSRRGDLAEIVCICLLNSLYITGL